MNLFFAGGLATFLLIGLPVAFSLGMLAVLGMFLFNGEALLLHKFRL